MFIVVPVDLLWVMLRPYLNEIVETGGSCELLFGGTEDRIKVKVEINWPENTSSKKETVNSIIVGVSQICKNNGFNGDQYGLIFRPEYVGNKISLTWWH